VSYTGEIIYHKIIEIDVKKLNKPETYILGDAYPNPFNPKTIISWQIPTASHVELTIFNILGEKVSTLVSEKQPEGYFEYEWNAGRFSSGIYYYVLKAGNFFDSKKMILLK